MGGAGTALSADAFSAFHNAAPLSSAETRAGGGYTYLPWMRSLIPRNDLHAAAAYFKPNAKQAVSLGFRHFTQYGSERTDNGNVLGRLRPRDMAFDIGYPAQSPKDSPRPLTGRYIRSDAGTGHTGNAVAFDAGLFYRQTLSRSHALNWIPDGEFRQRHRLRGGGQPLPWRLKAGVAADLALAQAHRLTLTAEADWRLRPLRSRRRGRAASGLNTDAAESRPCGEATAWATAQRANSVTDRSARASVEIRRGRCGLPARRREFPAARHVDADHPVQLVIPCASEANDLAARAASQNENGSSHFETVSRQARKRRILAVRQIA